MGAYVKTLFLSADSSPLFGAARVLDLCGVFDEYNTSPSEEEADSKALFWDWAIVGEDLRNAMREFEIGHTR
jgi:hypothetical protein